MAAFGAGAAVRAVERDGFWACAAHPRRQKHREMPPPGASAPAYAATVEPASSPPHANIQGKTRRQRVMERVLGDGLGVGCFLQRISASDSNFLCRREEWPACSGRSSNEGRVRF